MEIMWFFIGIVVTLFLIQFSRAYREKKLNTNRRGAVSILPQFEDVYVKKCKELGVDLLDRDIITNTICPETEFVLYYFPAESSPDYEIKKIEAQIQKNVLYETVLLSLLPKKAIIGEDLTIISPEGSPWKYVSELLPGQHALCWVYLIPSDLLVIGEWSNSDTDGLIGEFSCTGGVITQVRNNTKDLLYLPIKEINKPNIEKLSS